MEEKIIEEEDDMEMEAAAQWLSDLVMVKPTLQQIPPKELGTGLGSYWRDSLLCKRRTASSLSPTSQWKVRLLVCKGSKRTRRVDWPEFTVPFRAGDTRPNIVEFDEQTQQATVFFPKRDWRMTMPRPEHEAPVFWSEEEGEHLWLEAIPA